MTEPTSILVDYSTIVKPHKIRDVLPKPPPTAHDIGLILIIPRSSLKQLESRVKGLARVKYLGSQKFIDTIIDHVFFIYNPDSKLCHLLSIKQLDHVLPLILTNLPNDITIFASIPLNDPNFSKNISNLISHSFSEPWICSIGDIQKLCMMKKNDTLTKVYNPINDIRYLLAQYTSSNCTLQVKLSSDASKYLKQTTSIGSTVNSGGDISQKEIAGMLYISSTTSDLVQILDIDQESIITGDEERIQVVPGLFSFHSHPKSAYESHQVTVGWPSAQDYIGFASSFIENGTILHVVSSLEGLYIISLVNYWFHQTKLNDQLSSFILDNYTVDKTKSPNQYTEQINSISFKTQPLFILRYMTWSDSTLPFSVSFPKTGQNCFVRQSVYDKITNDFSEIYT